MNIQIDASQSPELIALLQGQLSKWESDLAFHQNAVEELRLKIEPLQTQLKGLDLSASKKGAWNGSTLRSAFHAVSAPGQPKAKQRKKRVSLESLKSKILTTLEHEDGGGLGVTELCDATDASPSSVYRALKEMEGDGSVQNMNREWLKVYASKE